MTYHKKLTARARLILFIAPLILFALMAAVGYNILAVQLRDSARQNSRQHATEINLDFQQYLTPHLELLRQSARSYTVGRWVADIGNTAQKERALRNIEVFHRYNPNTVLMFTSATDHVTYLFPSYDPQTGIEAGATRSSLNQVSQTSWFQASMNSPGLLHISIQVGQSLESSTLWLNHRVYFEGEAVGVASVGFSLLGFMEALFANLPSHVQVYMVDRESTVHINSRNMALENMDNLIQSMDDMAHTPEILDTLAAYFDLLRPSIAADRITGVNTGLFPFNLEIGTTLDHSVHGFSFANVVPLAGTSWIMVLLSSHQNTWTDLTLLPLVLTMVLGIFLVALLGSAALRRQIIEPIEKLAMSVTHLAGLSDKKLARETKVYGIHRDDEIGYLARNIDMFLHTLMIADEDLKQMQVLEESNRAKSQFLARMSHEIRTPISAILGISEVQIKNVNLEPDTTEALHKIYSSGNLLLGIINDILDLSRIENGAMDIIPDTYQTASLISDVLQRHMEIATAKSLSLDVNVSEHIPSYLVGDVLRIQQVLNNVLSNSFKYTLNGGVSISFDWVADEITGVSQLKVIISDTGIGMTPEQVNTIFDEYARFSETEYRSIDGTGLGMPIVNHLLALMGAKISISSTKTVGTTVTLLFPQGVDPKQSAPIGPDTARSLRQFKEVAFRAANLPQFVIDPLPYGRVLIVDDLDVNLYVAEQMLSMYQLHTIDTAINGYKAIDLIKNGKRYDIIFMDHMMPGLDGIETLNRLREMGYTQPVVALTANAMIGQEGKFLKHGFDDFLSKPIHSKCLDQVLRRFVATDEITAELSRTVALTPPQADQTLDPVTGLPLSIVSNMQQRIRSDFQKNQAQVVSQLQASLSQDDMRQAHLLIHSLKGAASLLRANKLMRVAANIEAIIHDGLKPSTAYMSLLEREVAATLAEVDTLLKDMPDEPASEHLLSQGNLAFKELLDKLAPLVSENSTRSLSLIPELALYADTGQLISALEEFEFVTAKRLVKKMRGS